MEDEYVGSENLFLFEFLVDGVKLDPKCECSAPRGETCVGFRFLDNDFLEICEADFTPERRYDAESSVEEKIKSGKSCLFSLSPERTLQCSENFNVDIVLSKRMPAGWLPDRVQFGAATLNITNLFNELIDSIQTSEGGAPLAKTLKDVFDVYDAAGNEQEEESDAVIGKISIYIRLSCFGKLIVTQFQMNLEDKSVLFKDKEGKSLYRYKKAQRGGKRGKSCTPRQAQVAPSGADTCPAQASCAGYTPNQFSAMGYFPPQAQPPYQATLCGECSAVPTPPCATSALLGMNSTGMGMTPCIECGNLPTAPCAAQMMRSMPLADTPCDECQAEPAAPCAAPPQAEPEGNYQEIGASMGGNSLTIRVHKDKTKVEQVDGDDSVAEVCACALARPGKRRDQHQQQQRFDMRPGVQQSPFSFKMAEAGRGRGGDVVVNPPVTTLADGTQLTEFSDPNQERFVLRIGKKNEGIEKKQNLELELCTPKGPDLKPIPKKETRETQCEEVDFPGDGKKGKGKDKGKGKGKGKKGKGKKGKK